jgi:hypothetical protein
MLLVKIFCLESVSGGVEGIEHFANMIILQEKPGGG